MRRRSSHQDISAARGGPCSCGPSGSSQVPLAESVNKSGTVTVPQSWVTLEPVCLFHPRHQWSIKQNQVMLNVLAFYLGNGPRMTSFGLLVKIGSFWMPDELHFHLLAWARKLGFVFSGPLSKYCLLAEFEVCPCVQEAALRVFWCPRMPSGKP